MGGRGSEDNEGQKLEMCSRIYKRMEYDCTGGQKPQRVVEEEKYVVNYLMLTVIPILISEMLEKSRGGKNYLE